VVIQTAVAGDLELGAGTERCTLGLGETDRLQDSITIPQEIEGHTGQSGRGHGEECHGRQDVCRVPYVVCPAGVALVVVSPSFGVRFVVVGDSTRRGSDRFMISAFGIVC
jgi:hypothetical protein